MGICNKCGEVFDEYLYADFDEKNNLSIVKKLLSRLFQCSVSKINMIKQSGYYLIDSLDRIPDCCLQTNQKILIEEGDIQVKGWNVKLSNQPTIDFYARFIESEKNIIKHFHRTSIIHRGHLLANLFKEYIIPEDKCLQNDVYSFFGKGCESNITYQTKDANCNSNNHRGQLYFENKVIEYLKKASSNTVIYGVYNVSLKELCLGRVISIQTDNNVKPELPNLVFVPNLNENSKNFVP